VQDDLDQLVQAGKRADAVILPARQGHVGEQQPHGF